MLPLGYLVSVSCNMQLPQPYWSSSPPCLSTLVCRASLADCIDVCMPVSVRRLIWFSHQAWILPRYKLGCFGQWFKISLQKLWYKISGDGPVDLDEWMAFEDHQRHQVSRNKYIAQAVVWCTSYSPSILANRDRETNRLHERSMIDRLDNF